MREARNLTMSAKELDRLEIIGRVVERRLRQWKAAEQLGLSLRQVERLCRAYRADGAVGLISRKRGRASNRKLASALGELVQIDGCEDAWFEDRGPKCTLLVYVDDATSRLMELRFLASESAFDYFTSTRAYLERYGKNAAVSTSTKTGASRSVTPGSGCPAVSSSTSTRASRKERSSPTSGLAPC